MKVRPAAAEDFETLWQIDQNCFPPGIAYGREELQWYMKLPRAFALVGESKGKVVGFVLVSIAQVKAKKRGAGAAESTIESVGHVITIDVLAKWRRDGVGSKLLAQAEDQLRQEGCRTVLLETGVDNDSAIRFYKKHGYSVMRTLPRYYLDSLDAFLMGKKL
jgi:[ribosomal protein S18]-alanine N-acetyltransferase